MEIGDTLLLQDKSIDEHLWVVISQAHVDPDHVVIVNLTSHDDQEKDSSCVLDVEDHPWIKHKTSVRYRDARIAKDAELDLLVKTGALKTLAPASDALIGRILDGAQSTVHLPMKCRAILEAQGLIER